MKLIKLLFLSIILVFLQVEIKAQGNSCPGTPFCTSVGTTFSYANVHNGSTASGATSYGCLGSEPDPSWFYIKTSGAGTMTYSLTQGTTVGANNLDVDFIAYGPFTASTFTSGAACSNLTGSCSGDHSCSGNIADCSYSAAASETMTLNSPGAGYYYIILITNYDGSAGYISFTQTGGQGSDCSITCNPTTIPLVAQDTTNYFNGTTTTMPSGSTAQCNLPFFVYQNNPTAFTGPTSDIWEPCLMVDINPFKNNVNTKGSLDVYEGATKIFDFCNSGCGYGTIGGSVATAGNDYNDYLYYLDSTKAHSFVFCNSGTVGPTTVTIKNCWDGTVYAGPTTWNVTTASCFTLNVPNTATIGSAGYSISPAGGASGVYDYHTGYAYVDPNNMAAGTYTLTYTFHGINSCAPGTGTYVFTVPAKPNVTVTPSTTTICAGTSVTLTGGGANTYTWLPGSATGGTHSVNTAGTYTVTGTNTATGCKNTATATVTTAPNPTLTITGTPTVCSGSSTTLSVSATPASTFSWSVGSTSSSISVSPSSTTPYSVVGTAGTCTASASITVTVTPSPTLTISGTNTLCSGNSTTLTGGGATNFTWTPGPVTTNTISVSPGTGTTNYTLTGANGTCVSTKTVAVTVTATPTLAIAGTTTLCSGGSTTLTGSGASGFTWTPGPVTTNTISVSPGIGTTNYTLTGNTGSCTSTKTVAVNVTATPTLAPSAAPSSICSGNSTTLTANASPSATTFSWSPGAATTSTVSVSPGSGTTTYTLLVTNGGACPASQTVAVIVTPTPTVSISGNLTICSGASTILTGTTATTYSWNTGATTNTITVTPPAGNTTYTLTGYNSTCSATAIATVTVTPTPTVSFSGNADICSGQSEVITGLGATTFTWLPGPVTTSTISVSPGTSANYTLTGANGTCTNSAIASVSVTPTPTMNITGNAPICNGQSLVLTGSSATSYSWSAGGITTNTISVNPTSNATYTVTGSNGTCTATAVATVTVNALPQIGTPSVTSAPCGQVTGCINNVPVTNGTPNYQYSWDGGTTYTNTSTYCGIAAGTYPLQVMDANGCLANANVIVPSSSGPSAPAVTASSTVSCLGDSAVFTINPVTPGNTYSWTDYTGVHAGTTYTITNINPAGTYSVSVQATDGSGCLSAGTTYTIAVNPLPPTSVSGTNHFCKGASTTLNASPSGGGYGYQWSMGGSPIGGATSATYNANAAGNYAVTITDNSTGCKAASVGNYTVTIDSLPKIDTTSIVVTNSSCGGSTGSVTNVTVTPGAGNSYSWTNSSGTVVGTSINLGNIPAGSYCLLVTTNPNLCKDSICGITVNNAGAPPVPTLTTPNNTYCQGATQNPIVVNGTGTFSWYSDAALTTQIASGTTYTPNVVSTTTVYVAATNSGCQSAALPVVITINPNPTAPVISGSASNPLVECQGATAQSVSVATTGSVASTPVWYNGSTYVTSGTSYTPSTAAPGTTVYTIADSATATGCKDMSAANVLTVTVTINQTPTGPTISGSVPNPLVECQGVTPQSVSVATTGTVTSVPVWYNGSSYVTTGTSYTPSTATPGTTVYTIADSATTAGGCKSSVTGNVLTVTVTINSTPVNPSVSSTGTTVCSGQPTGAITATGSAGGTIIWSTSPTMSPVVSTGTSYTPPSSTAGTTVYYIQDSTSAGCKSAAAATSVTVTVNPNPTITGTAIIDSSKCGANNGDVLGLTATGGTPGYTYQWFDGTGAVVGNASDLTPVGPGSYSLVVTDSKGCIVSSTSSYAVGGSSSISAGFIPSVNAGQAPLAVTFSNTSTGAANYAWDFGSNTTTSTAANPAYTYTTNGTYTVVLVATNGSCIAFDTTIIIVDIETSIVIPNVFSPNGDGINDEFIIACTGMKTLNCDIFNRWGQLVYTLTAPNQNWDGRMNNGNMATEGTYYFMLNAVGTDKKTYTYQGPITLVK